MGRSARVETKVHLLFLLPIFFGEFGKWETVLKCLLQGHSQKVLTRGMNRGRLTSAMHDCSLHQPTACLSCHAMLDQTPRPGTKSPPSKDLSHWDLNNCHPCGHISKFLSKSAVCCLQSATDVYRLRQPTACLSCQAGQRPASKLLTYLDSAI